MQEANYWLGPERRPKPVVDVGEARCGRCPYPVGPVPRDRVFLLRARGPRRYLQVFVCPYCRTDVTAEVSLERALELLAGGARAERRPAGDDRPLTLADLLDFAAGAASTDELARLALEDGLAG